MRFQSLSKGSDKISKIENNIINKAHSFIDGRRKVAHLFIVPLTIGITLSRGLNATAQKIHSLSSSILYKLGSVFLKEEDWREKAESFWNKFKSSLPFSPNPIAFVKQFYRDIDTKAKNKKQFPPLRYNA